MPDVKVTRGLIARVRVEHERVRADYPNRTADWDMKLHDDEALCALAEAVLDAEESGALRAAGVRNLIFLRVRRLLGKEERPGE